MRFYQDTIDGTCGVGFVCGFNNPDHWADDSPVSSIVEGGAGLHVAGFINTPDCKAAFEEMKATHKMLLQTRPRLNTNSGNDFIFCVYDRNWPNFTPEMNAKKVWPW